MIDGMRPLNGPNSACVMCLIKHLTAVVNLELILEPDAQRLECVNEKYI